MKIIAAIDLMDGLAVRGIAGQRQQYAPLQSVVASSAEPGEVARGLSAELGIHDLYVADLDAIAGAEPSWGLYERLLADGGRLWIDAGVGDVDRARQMNRFAEQHSPVEDSGESVRSGVTGIVVGLESVGSRQRLRRLCDVLSPGSLIFSLDMKAGRPFGATGAWQDTDPMTIAAEAIELGVERLIVLDLSAVGVEAGCPTLPLCRSLRERFPRIEITTGGGVRGIDDLRQLAAAGCDAALLASSLHDGRIQRDDLAGMAALDQEAGGTR